MMSKTMETLAKFITLVTVIIITNLFVAHGLRLKRGDTPLAHDPQVNVSDTTNTTKDGNTTLNTNGTSSYTTFSTTTLISNTTESSILNPTSAAPSTATSTINSELTSPSPTTSTTSSTPAVPSTATSTPAVPSTATSTPAVPSTATSTPTVPSTATSTLSLASTSSSTTTQPIALPTTTTTTNPNVGNNATRITDIISLLGPRKAVDVVFILARSQSIGKRNFYESSRYLTALLLKQYATIHKDYARVAAVSYATSSSVDYNDISADDGHEPLDKCQLFPPNQQTSFPLDTLKYRIEDDQGTCAVFDAFQSAWQILEKGKVRRPGVSQVVVLITDGNGQCESKVNPFIGSSVNMFGVGLGAFYLDAVLKSWIVPSSRSAMFDAWKKMTDTNITSLQNGDLPMFAKMNSSITCGAGFNESCYCNLDLGLIKVCPSEGGCKNTSATQDCPDCRWGSCGVISNDAICRCYDYAYGDTCQFFYDSCRFANICINGTCGANPDSNGGHFRCACNTGFQGDFCIDPIPTSGPTPSLLTITQIFTVFQNVTDIPLDVTKTIIVSSVVGGVILLAIIITIIVFLIFCLRRQKAQKREKDGQSILRERSATKESGIQSTISKLTSKIRGKGSNNFTMRLSQLWNRNLNDDDGMPSVPPTRHSEYISRFDLQNVGHEETILQNELIHDNKPAMKNWKSFLDDLVEKEVMTKAVMANLFTKDIMHTDTWTLDWAEIYSLDVNFGIKKEIMIQGDTYIVDDPEDGVISGSLADKNAKDQKLISLGRTKKYMVIGIVLMSEKEDETKCRNEIKWIISHVKLEGY